MGVHADASADADPERYRIAGKPDRDLLTGDISPMSGKHEPQLAKESIAVADGMGGHAAGDVANALALETLVEAL